MSEAASAAGSEAGMEGGPFTTLDAMRGHLLGHRHLTRRVIEAFPEGELFSYRAGEMRTFGQIVQELLQVAEPMVHGVATGEWNAPEWGGDGPDTKAALLEEWDRSTAAIEDQWSRITPARLLETDVAFGAYEGLCRDHILYVIDNEVHHRGQGYTYLRALGVEPPPFWERAPAEG